MNGSFDRSRQESIQDGESNFAVLSHGVSRNLLVNEIGPYEGTVLLDSGAMLIDITADGDWTLELG